MPPLRSIQVHPQEPGVLGGGAAPEGDAAGGPNGAAGGGNAADDVIDAEFTETK